MGWFKVDDQFADHPKFDDLSNDAVALWIRVLAYCNRHMTDGLVKASTAARLAKSENAEEVIAELLSARLWRSAAGGYQIHDFKKWSTPKDERQRKAEEAKARKDAWKERRKAGGTQEERVPDSKRNAGGTRSDDVPERDRNAQSEAEAEAERSPCSPPVGDGTKGLALEAPVSAKPKRQPKRRESAPAVDAPMVEVNDWLVARRCPRLDDREDGADVLRFLNHHRAKGNTFADWGLAWGNWKSGRFIGGLPFSAGQRAPLVDPDAAERERLGPAPKAPPREEVVAKSWDELEGTARRLWGSREAYEAACMPKEVA